MNHRSGLVDGLQIRRQFVKQLGWPRGYQRVTLGVDMDIAQEELRQQLERLGRDDVVEAERSRGRRPIRVDLCRQTLGDVVDPPDGADAQPIRSRDRAHELLRLRAL